MTRNLKIHLTLEDATKFEILKINFQPSVHIFPGLGEHFSNLRILVIVSQQIKFVERDSFVSLQKLTHLNLNRNQIEVLPEDVFMDLPNLEYLDFANNLIMNLPDKLFSHLKNIRQITFSDNHIKVLPSNLFLNNLKLKLLITYNNPLTTNNVDFSAIPNVQLWN